MENSNLYCESFDYLIKKCDLTLREIAELLNTDEFTIIQWQNHSKSPSSGDIHKLSQIVHQRIHEKMINIDSFKILETINNLDDTLSSEFNDELDDIKKELAGY